MGWRLASAIILLIACAGYYIPTTLQPPPSSTNLLFFDGVCNLCDGFVNFVADTDSENRVQFGALQRHKELLVNRGAGRYAEGGEEELSTLVFIQGSTVYVRSEAALRVMALLDQPWSAVSIFILLPRPLRDLGYKLVAEYRYVVFGKSETCRMPTERFSARFIENHAAAKSNSPFAKGN